MYSNEVAMSKRESGWLPIETAPSSGTYWLGAIDGNGDDAVYLNHDWKLVIKPTHWMRYICKPALPRLGNQIEVQSTERPTL